MKKLNAFIAVGLLGILLAIGFEQYGHAQLVSSTVRALTLPFAVTRDNITTASVNLPFGFTSSAVMFRAGTANTAEVVIDWTGGTAVCTAVNTAGGDRYAVGEKIIKENLHINSVSVIACSGTQTLRVTAWQ